jgi:hypothetical protein
MHLLLSEHIAGRAMHSISTPTATLILHTDASGKVRILNSLREVVALHKERYVFPTFLCVTKASGSGMDSIFMGVIRVRSLQQLNQITQRCSLPPPPACGMHSLS